MPTSGPWHPAMSLRVPHRLTLRLGVPTLVCTPVLVWGAGPLPVLRCVLESGGSTLTHDAIATADPCTVQPVVLNDRFRFKAVVVADDEGRFIDHVKRYTHELGGAGRTLLHQVSYSRRMVEASLGQASLTGVQWVYARSLERQSSSNAIGSAPAHPRVRPPLHGRAA